MRRHNHLTDDVFKNSKYIATINRTTDFKDIRKETRKEKGIIFLPISFFYLSYICYLT